MASFIEQLWESIFTPGPTPVLLKATNATFACLQVVLLVLLFATYSVHFVILSILSAGLWWAINWFATELKAAQVAQEKERFKAEQRASRQVVEDSETEVETAIAKTKTKSASKEVEVMPQAGDLKHRAESMSGTKSGVSTEDEWEKVSESEKDK
ncbi:ER protein Pkr1-domain-containing protein [Xylariomycetidae sp. FL0641]|nr:ER protein Pkr1-domain-containing protein [Xylariomycetidae sp. FL0641]